MFKRNIIYQPYKKISPWRKVAMATWKHINDGPIYGELKIDARPMLTKIKEFKEILGEYRYRESLLPAPKQDDEKSEEALRYGSAHVRLIKAMISRRVKMPDSRTDPIAFERARVAWLMKYGIAPEYIAKVECCLSGWSEYGKEVISKIPGGEG